MLSKSEASSGLMLAHPGGLFAGEVGILDRHIREGRFQRSLALIAGVSGLLGGLDVTLEHYKGSYGQRIMYSPVLLSGALFATGVAGAMRPKIARTWLPIVSTVLLADGVIGFAFHIRGIHRKPGGWRQPLTNLVMGPPIFAPLLLGIGGFLGVIASLLRPETGAGPALPRPRDTSRMARLFRDQALTDGTGLSAASVREGRFQTTMCAATALSAALNGLEALNSHYKSGFKSWSQWLPLGVAPVLTVTAAAGMVSPRAARKALPAVAAVALATGSIGFFYHLRGIIRRPGGLQRPLYNFTYGPPAFAPLLFAASGCMGLLASRLRR